MSSWTYDFTDFDIPSSLSSFRPVSPCPFNTVEVPVPILENKDFIDELPASASAEEEKLGIPHISSRSPNQRTGGHCRTAFVFTCWKIIPLEFKPELFRYLVYQLERSPQTGRQHFQGYAVLTSDTPFSIIRKHFGWKQGDAWIKTAKGTPQQNLEYCSKTETRVDGPWEFGEIPAENDVGKQGQRNDLIAIVDKCKQQKSVSSIITDHPAECVKYIRNILTIRSFIGGGPCEQPEFFILWGDSGTGKTESVRRKYPEAYIKSGSNKWWDGYDGQEVAVIDDYRSCDGLGLREFLTIVNTLKAYVETKGGGVYLNIKKLFVTSNPPPEEWFYSDWTPLKRRITKQIKFRWVTNETSKKVVTEEIKYAELPVTEYADISMNI